ncbi:MAG: sigma-54-dependent Fis family transcriptional regulator [Marinilabiliales bacterium]|nr:MAG: sigma-54-dependent Fis family transcriptional regulator [Marinilabiliales bacterium]
MRGEKKDIPGMDLQAIKRRFGIIGNSTGLNRAIEVAYRVAPTDLSVLISGESGTGKEVFPQIIHQFSARKHGPYIAVNCGAIPEGTIDSELFGHEKGAFTGAHDKRSGYFEVANNGTIFLDEVSELPLSTQVRLLRVLESGEFIKVGSSKPLKTNVRIVAATNVDIIKLLGEGKFREDLYYRLNTVPVLIPPLRDRKEDVLILFRKFSMDFAERYRMPEILLNEEARQMLIQYSWPGNVRQLKNITEQISIIEKDREIDGDVLRKYLPDYSSETLPALISSAGEKSFASEREILYKILFDMKSDMHDLKKLVHEIILKSPHDIEIDDDRLMDKLYSGTGRLYDTGGTRLQEGNHQESPHIEDTEEIIEESLSLQDKEMELIRKALDKYGGRRKMAANELGISERTLYRKIKQYDIE